VSSPICLRQADGTLRRPIIGQVAAMDDGAAMAGLNAAVQAWDHGRGPWPTMSVAERIAAVESFATEMLKVRQEVVNLLMWEIGKSLDDSSKEFDRTLHYIHKTVEALKEVDRTNSRFSLDGGVIAQVRRSPLGSAFRWAVQLPLERNVHHADPGAHNGKYGGSEAVEIRRVAAQSLLRAFAARFPPGVVNFSYGRGAKIAPALMKSGNVDVLALIGSSRAADILKRDHPRPHRLRSILGLMPKTLPWSWRTLIWT
jgi:acyl-CoA reductase-like NAD-dependent aldehyde dehydrogenase